MGINCLSVCVKLNSTIAEKLESTRQAQREHAVIIANRYNSGGLEFQVYGQIKLQQTVSTMTSNLVTFVGLQDMLHDV